MRSLSGRSCTHEKGCVCVCVFRCLLLARPRNRKQYAPTEGSLCIYIHTPTHTFPAPLHTQRHTRERAACCGPYVRSFVGSPWHGGTPQSPRPRRMVWLSIKNLPTPTPQHPQHKTHTTHTLPPRRRNMFLRAERKEKRKHCLACVVFFVLCLFVSRQNLVLAPALAKGGRGRVVGKGSKISHQCFCTDALVSSIILPIAHRPPGRTQIFPLPSTHCHVF